MLDQIDHWISQLSKFELGLLIYFYILFLIWVWASDEKEKPSKPDTTGVSNPEPETSLPILPDEKLVPYKPSIFTPQKYYQITVNKKRFVLEVIRWGLRNIPYEGLTQRRRRAVNLEVSYYKHKKNNGVYCSSQNKIKVYVNTHSKISQLIDSSIHELCHHFQYCADPRNYQTRYNRLMEYTYAKHPMEIEARNMAAKYVNPCFEYLVQKGYLKKAP
jgi:hypothetical protein